MSKAKGPSAETIARLAAWKEYVRPYADTVDIEILSNDVVAVTAKAKCANVYFDFAFFGDRPSGSVSVDWEDDDKCERVVTTDPMGAVAACLEGQHAKNKVK